MEQIKWRKILILGLSLLLVATAVSACTVAAETPEVTQAAVDAEYHNISAAEAKALMDSEQAVIVLDVREQSEFDLGHIPGAVLLPVGSIAELAAETLPDKGATILVYCRSGNRSRTAANTLVDLGYTQVYDFGGIIDWPYDVVTE